LFHPGKGTNISHLANFTYFEIDQNSQLMIVVNRFIVHEVEKEVKQKGETESDDKKDVILKFSKTIPTVDNFSMRLIEETHKSFGLSSSLKNTQFEEGHSTVFHTGLLNYFAKEEDKEFYTYTQKALEDLKVRIQKEPFATGGYYLFADYKYDDRRYISAVLLRKKHGINFKIENGVFLPIDSDNLDIEKIAMGFRLNYALYNSTETDRKYIALVTNQRDHLSVYFKEWVQAANIITNDANTAALVKVLNAVDMPDDELGQPVYKTREEFRKAFYDVIEQARDKMVNLFDLSKHFYGADNEQHLTQYAQTKQVTIDPEFKRSPAILKKLITVRAKVEGIELTVDYDKINKRNVEVKEDRIIIHSKDLASQINAQNDGNK